MAFQLSGYVNTPDPKGTPAAVLMASIDASTLDIPVDSVTFLPPSTTQFVIKIGSEKVLITSRTVLTVHADAAGRGYEGTVAASHASGADVFNPLTMASLARHPRSMTTLGDLEVMGVDGAPVRFAAPANGDYSVRWTDGVPSWVAASGGGTPAAPDASIQFNNAGTFGGHADFTWTAGGLTDLRHAAFGPDAILNEGPAWYDPGAAYRAIVNLSEQVTDVSVNVVGGVLNYLNIDPSADVDDTHVIVGFDSEVLVPAGNTHAIDNLTGGYFAADYSGSGTINHLVGTYNYAFNREDATVSEAYGSFAEVSLRGLGTISVGYALVGRITTYDAGTITNAYAVGAQFPAGAGTIDNGFAFYGNDMAGVATNPYYFWADSRGVLRFKEDASHDGVGQATLGNYNPLYPKYTPAAPDFERSTWYWDSNRFYFGLEQGDGSGTPASTLRQLQLIGAGLLLGTDILPTSDPGLPGQVYRTGGTMMVSL